MANWLVNVSHILLKEPDHLICQFSGINTRNDPYLIDPQNMGCGLGAIKRFAAWFFWVGVARAVSAAGY